MLTSTGAVTIMLLVLMLLIADPVSSLSAAKFVGGRCWVRCGKSLQRIPLRRNTLGGGTGLQFLRPTAANFRQKMYKAQNFNFVFKFLQNGALSALSFVFSNENFETKDRVFWRANI